MRCADDEVTSFIDHRAFFLRIGTPQHKDHRTLKPVYHRDDFIGKDLPALALVRVRQPPFDGQHTVQQQHTLVSPVLQVTILIFYAEIIIQFLEDIDQ